MLFGLVHLASVLLYHTHESRNPPAYHTAVRILRESRAPLFTLDNIWGPVSGQPLTPWKQNGGDGASALLKSVYDRFSEGSGTADLKKAKALLDQRETIASLKNANS